MTPIWCPSAISFFGKPMRGFMQDFTNTIQDGKLMSEVVYDLTISEVAKILDKSDRQVRRYIKEKRLKAKPIRVDGHIKLMFNREAVIEFKEKVTPQLPAEELTQGTVVEGQVVQGIDGAMAAEDITVIDESDTEVPSAVKYVVDALKEQINGLNLENKDLHYQLEQRSGQVGFLQGKIEALQEEVKALSPATKPSVDKKPWFKRMFSRE